ncbi:hypothetical protein K504DRAFT_477890 [Pleomassaria siparia CBS 279.74]|uniref:Carboxypeptidase M14A n=1 Tax=Pleomassaria siparia CBS 279.74 TaxID=1314801 RepID=A0A6G1KPD9_9PLEO|nr:hypothetical protein K504DRAFT_477890 [Pleomassaria siparia CBS 279.74]
MKFLSLTLASLGLASAASVANKVSKVSYDGWKVFRVNDGDTAEFQAVVDNLQLKTWKGRVGHSAVVDVVVPPTQIEAFTSSGLDTKLMHDDLGASIADETNFPVYASAKDARAPNATWFNAYHTIADHFQWLKDLSAAYPANSEIIVAGKSLEGRDIQGIHIWGSGGKGSQKGVVWHSTVHAREWITTMVNEYAAYKLLTATDTATAAYKDKYDFYIFPLVNPDGFAYTQSTDRLWRKNRQTTTSASCVGRDINRNWPIQWAATGGASTSPCAEDYKGASAGDGVETKVLKAHLDGVAAGKGVQLYMDIHSYHQLWMYPYGYTCTGTIPEAATYKTLVAGAVAAVKASHGLTYEPGPICSTIYKVTGDSVDYAYDVAKAKFSMTVEMRDTGNYGFVLPPAQIVPGVEEMWAGLSYLLANM